MIKNKEPIPIAEMKSDNLRPSNSMKPKMKIAVATTLDVARQGDSNADTNREPSHFHDPVDTRCKQGVRSAFIANLDTPLNGCSKIIQR